jgi:hypothetical protein
MRKKVVFCLKCVSTHFFSFFHMRETFFRRNLLSSNELLVFFTTLYQRFLWILSKFRFSKIEVAKFQISCFSTVSLYCIHFGVLKMCLYSLIEFMYSCILEVSRKFEKNWTNSAIFQILQLQYFKFRVFLQ